MKTKEELQKIIKDLKCKLDQTFRIYEGIDICS